MPSRLRPALLALLVAAATALAGCGGGDSSSSGASSEPPSAAAKAGASRAKRTVPVKRAAGVTGRERASSSSPSVGVCGRAHGRVASFDLLPDTPGPKCLVVGPGQRLRFVNETGRFGASPQPVRLDFAGFRATIPPGGAVVLEAAVDSYLGPGVHAVETEGAPGPEVWLQP